MRVYTYYIHQWIDDTGGFEEDECLSTLLWIRVAVVFVRQHLVFSSVHYITGLPCTHCLYTTLLNCHSLWGSCIIPVLQRQELKF